MTNRIEFDSASFPHGKTVDLACGHISLNEIVFTAEGITVLLDACTGKLDVCDGASNKLLSAKIALPHSGDEKISELRLLVSDGKIRLGIPEYSYKDNYPHCDGEHDRWTKILRGFSDLEYDIAANKIDE